MLTIVRLTTIVSELKTIVSKDKGQYDKSFKSYYFK